MTFFLLNKIQNIDIIVKDIQADLDPDKMMHSKNINNQNKERRGLKQRIPRTPATE